MKPKKTTIAVILLLLTTALVGLAAIQVFFLDQAYRLQSRTFRGKAERALASVVEKLETRETLDRVRRLSVRIDNRDGGMLAFVDTGDPGSLPSPGLGPRVEPGSKSVTVHLDGERRIRLYDLGVDPALDIHPARAAVEDPPAGGTLLLDAGKPSGAHRIELAGAPSDGPRQYRLFIDEAPFSIMVRNGEVDSIVSRPTRDELRAALVDKVLEQDAEAERPPVLERIDPETLERLVLETLDEHGIHQQAAYGIVSADGGVLLARPEGLDGSLAASPIRTRLFPHDIRSGADDLVFHFPAERADWLRRLRLPALLAFLFILVTVGCFAAVLRIVLVQKRFASLLTDFVNNMTHEFKTPLATLSLAGDTLDDEAVRGNPEKLDGHARVIREESARMRHQVEKALEMALLERQDLGLVPVPVNVPELLSRAAEPHRTAAQQRGGSIEIDAADDTPEIEGDEIHLLNVFSNLFDNAIRYNSRPPEIRARAAAGGKGVVITVEDNGIGLAPVEANRVFDRYYRVSGGNVQEAGGFGLGLSYVKLIVQAHGGTVRVRSEAGRGSVFEVRLPRRMKGRKKW